MKKILSTLLLIIFLQVQLFSFFKQPTQAIPVTVVSNYDVLSSNNIILRTDTKEYSKNLLTVQERMLTAIGLLIGTGAMWRNFAGSISTQATKSGLKDVDNIVNTIKKEYSSTIDSKVAKGTKSISKGTTKVASGVGKTEIRKTISIVSYYPINDGALIGTKKTIILQPGTIVDRYGPLKGKYLAPVDTPLEMRALPYDTDLSQYRKFIILEPLRVESSITAPAFNKIGLGTQYKTKYTLDVLLEKNILNILKEKAK